MVYEFECHECRQVFCEAADADQLPPPCPECGSTKTFKHFKIAGIIYKGRGFYQTDHRPKQE